MPKNPPPYTHAQLVEIARGWLLGAGACHFVLTEFTTFLTWEIPDALGYLSGGLTVLVECKVSRADFFADAKKPFRQNPTLGLGAYRYYLVPAGLVRPEEVPPRWGLIYAYEGERARGVVHPLRLPDGARAAFEWGEHERNVRAERLLPLAALRRVHLRGMWHIVQTPVDTATDPEPRALPEPLHDAPEETPA